MSENHLLLVLPDELIERLAGEALAEGVEPGELLVELLASALPDALADTARGQLTGHRLASRSAACSSPNEQDPDADHVGVLDEAATTTNYVERKSTARPDHGASGGWER